MIALAIAAALATQAAPTFHILGKGSISCGTWSQDRAENGLSALSDTAWVGGYITSYNEYVSSSGYVSSGTDADGMFAWIDNYCKVHPLDDLTTAAHELIRELNHRHQ